MIHEEPEEVGDQAFQGEAEDQMAKTVDNVNKMLYDLVPPAKASMEREAAELQKLIDDLDECEDVQGVYHNGNL